MMCSDDSYPAQPVIMGLKFHQKINLLLVSPEIISQNWKLAYLDPDFFTDSNSLSMND